MGVRGKPSARVGIGTGIIAAAAGIIAAGSGPASAAVTHVITPHSIAATRAPTAKPPEPAGKPPKPTAKPHKPHVNPSGHHVKPLSKPRAKPPKRKAARAAYIPPRRHPAEGRRDRTERRRDLAEGMSGADVRALQRRLAFLRYYPGAIDGLFGPNTREALWAFQEVNRLPVNGVVTAATRRALARPRPYHPNDPRQAGTRVEVNLRMGVLVLIVRHRITLISHESSGGHYWYPCSGGGSCYAKTPTGEFHALYFVRGWDQGPLGAMYNPTFFNYSGYAIHGDTYVPSTPVSHGCVRLPMDIGSWFYKNLHITEKPRHGTQIWIYDQW